ncbi:MAG: cytochrome C oxidase subunit IV family protein [Pseudomonas sp.]|uniref:cytochrome C oxidase subunit IV family protein n=1 Tax=Pseudomonas sp. TaxID=306 RepID=UPI0030EFB2B9
MTTFTRDSITWVWLLLLLITGASWAVGSHVLLATNHLLAVGSILLFTGIKMHLVIRHFMEVNHAPGWLKWFCSAWLAVLFASLLWLYH